VASIEEIVGRLQSAKAKIGESVQMLSAAENAVGRRWRLKIGRRVLVWAGAAWQSRRLGIAGYTLSRAGATSGCPDAGQGGG
jgi:hypothetical protein